MKNSSYVLAAAAFLCAANLAVADEAQTGKEKAAVCFSCHGEDGNSNTGQVPQPPKLAGQHADYLIRAMQDYASGARSNPIMAAFAANLTDEDREDLAAYYASLPSSLSLISKTD